MKRAESILLTLLGILALIKIIALFWLVLIDTKEDTIQDSNEIYYTNTVNYKNI